MTDERETLIKWLLVNCVHGHTPDNPCGLCYECRAAKMLRADGSARALPTAEQREVGRG